MNKKVNKMRAEGRAVVDAKSFRRMNPMREMDFDSESVTSLASSASYLDYETDG
jgi:hypothetical protein